MFLTKKHIPRRTFLRGAGVTLALPLLDAMIPARTLLAQTAANPTARFVGIFFRTAWRPATGSRTTEGTGWEFPMIFEPLEPYREQVTILSGLHARSRGGAARERPLPTTGWRRRS